MSVSTPRSILLRIVEAVVGHKNIQQRAFLELWHFLIKKPYHNHLQTIFMIHINKKTHIFLRKSSLLLFIFYVRQKFEQSAGYVRGCRNTFRYFRDSLTWADLQNVMCQRNCLRRRICAEFCVAHVISTL